MPRFHPLRVSDIRRETAECVSVAFEVPAELQAEYAFTPGQYLTLRIVLNGEEVRRSYSLCSCPDEGEWRVAIKQAPQGLFSTYANEQLKEGDILDVMTPMGNFTVPAIGAGSGHHYVAFAAGSGITPIMSILQTVLKQEPRSRFTLVYGNRNTESVIFREKIEGLKNSYLQRLSVHYVMSVENPGIALYRGRINAEKCRIFFEKLIDIQDVDGFFLCGPMEMNNEVRDTLLDMGIDRKLVHVELFNAGEARQQSRKSAIQAAPAVLSQIRITLDGNTVEFPLASNGDTILEAALKAGADLPFACKGGVCCTCRAKLIEGAVEMEVNYALEPDELEAGYILTCQSHPKTEKVIVDFDR